MSFVKAVKGKKPVRLVLSGPSGSGKTFTALTFAKFLSFFSGKPTACIDTEYYRMSLYADKFDFDVNDWEPPYHPQRLINEIKEAESSGYGQLVVDSATHFYSMEGGLLQIVQDASKRFGGNQYAGWSVGTPIQNQLIETIIRSPLHIIFCVRAKQGYLETEKGTKKTYEKSGMELQQRDGFEYDFDFSIMMDMENNGYVSKGMGYLPTGSYVHKPDASTIETILKSITENSDEISAIPEKVVVAVPIKEKVQNLCVVLAKTNKDSVIEMIKKYEPSGLLPKVKEEKDLINLYNDLIAYQEKNNA